MYRYKCEVNNEDTIIAYETDNEIVDKTLFALVAENRRENRKVSVLLDLDDARLLCKQLQNFVNEQS